MLRVRPHLTSLNVARLAPVNFGTYDRVHLHVVDKLGLLHVFWIFFSDFALSHEFIHQSEVLVSAVVVGLPVVRW